jgi:membrane protease subunit (stomatin/prohibitin family)
MSILDLITKQFIDVIDWTESGDGVLAYRFPMQDREIQNGAQLTVRESQLALFVNEGKPADLFQPGLYTLTTRTLPVLTSLRNWDKRFASPFKSDVYFFSSREQLDQKWGTPNPVAIRDQEFGPIRIRAFGAYSYRLKDVRLFYQKVSGTRELYTVDDINGQLFAMITTAMASFLGTSLVGFVDMAANQTTFSETLQEPVGKALATYGLQLETFLVQSVSLPEELQERFDRAASMRIVGDVGRYAQYETADSIGTAAANPGGAAGIGAGLGAGMAIGQTMTANLASAPRPAAPAELADPLKAIEQLHALLGKGILTQAEFDAKKAELLQRIR